MANARILRRARLTGQEEFQRVFQSTFKLENSCLKILARHNGRDYPRLGLVIPKKWVKSAVA
ncbi:MAG: ribonuclease P protein component, partial [Gammaproteobacteria bacterium]|nr:ribonuclease P protein component [Gammaproteobacteria bacterium]